MDLTIIGVYYVYIQKIGHDKLMDRGDRRNVRSESLNINKKYIDNFLLLCFQ